LAILKLAQFQFSLNKSEESDLPLGQLAPVSTSIDEKNFFFTALIFEKETM
jgi:hypothetical protein